MGRVLSFAVLMFVAAFVCAQEPSKAQDMSTDRPNILVVMTDDQEASTLGRMPNVQKGLVVRGKTFTDFVFTYPLCCPSRVTIQTGLYPHNTGVVDNQPPDGGYAAFAASGLKDRSVGAWLDGAGYETGYFGRYMNGTPRSASVPGWDEFYAWAETERVGFSGIVGTRETVQDGARDRLASKKALGFLGGAGPSAEPFFAFVSFTAPHEPYYHPKRTDALFRDAQAPRRGGSFNERDISDKPAWMRQTLERMGREEVAATDEKYRDSLRSLVAVDGFVGEALGLLAERGELEDTYVVYLTDNGTHAGYHRLRYGKSTAYEEDLTFPLVVRGPGVPADATTGRLAGNHDLAPTVADLAGVEPPYPTDGRSLAPLLGAEEPEAWRDAVLSTNRKGSGWRESNGKRIPAWYAVRTEGETYVEYDSGARELYDLGADPYQLESSHDDPTRADEMAALSARLDALRDCAGESCRAAEGPYKALRTLARTR